MSLEFRAEIKKKIEETLSRYPRKEAAILPLLHAAQQEFGFISADAEKLIAQTLDINPIRVREVVTFYTMLSREPLGKYHIQVCSNLSCSLSGAEKLIDHLQKKLKVKPGQTTRDKKFSFSLVECLGACEIAPCMMVNFDYYGNLDKKKVDRILDGLK